MLIFFLTMIETEAGRASFKAFYETHELKCLHIAYKITGNQSMAEDALHNAFLVIIKDWENFSSLSCGIQLSRFVIIVKNKAIDLIREAKRKEHDELNDEIYDSPDENDEVGIIIENEEGYQILLRCVAKLPEIYKVAFELRFVQELGNNEIAELLKVTSKVVSMRIHRARLMLQDVLIKEGIDYGEK